MRGIKYGIEIGRIFFPLFLIEMWSNFIKSSFILKIKSSGECLDNFRTALVSLRYYLPLENGIRPFISRPPNDALYQIWLKLVHVVDLLKS